MFGYLGEEFWQDHGQVAVTLSNLGTALSHFRDYQQAKALYERALVIIEKHLGIGHGQVTLVLENISCVLHLREYH